MAPWLPPEGLVGDSALIRVSLGILGPRQYRCPARDAMAARPNLRSPERPRRKRELLESFTAGPFMAAMDLIEDHTRTADQALDAINRRPGRPIHDGIMQWTAHAVHGYRAAFAAEGAHDMHPMRNRWTYSTRLSAPDDRGAERYEINVWGRCYVSSDGTTRELRLITNRRDARVRADAEVAVAAFVVAHGQPGTRPERVRVVQFAILEGTIDTLFDDTVAAAAEAYRLHGRTALGAIVDSNEYRPGATCTDCPYTTVCPALPRTPGLLGIGNQARPRRSWSATSARAYRACPARDYLKQQRLPVESSIERNSAAERGRAVHAFLEQQHRSTAARTCSGDIPSAWVPTPFDLSEADRVLGATLLRHHMEVCPLRHATDVQTEPDLVYDDTDADVVVLAKPDLLYKEHGAWVWREVKTSANSRFWSNDVLMDYPQLALGIVLVARGALGPGRGRVELEVLRPDGADLRMFDPFTAGIRERAERVLLQHAQAWHDDDRFLAMPGRECHRCEVSRWCSVRFETAG
ncbi:PD-(D/E)XK nuclease family protein [Dactylosporangium sp. CA-139114]|uniref:PD-(D/E)XK nuclease family protein n=1 Tax=Dactylosporangium sp. CA-139114 TaxID=3239931 RepID=UPI003D96B6A1